MLEAALIQGVISLQAVVVLPPIGKWVNCVLKTTAKTLQDSIAPNGFYLVYLMPNLATCSARVSWGVFGYGGIEGDAGFGGGFKGRIGEYDSRSGASLGGLTEGWIGGEGPMLGAGKISSPSNPNALDGAFYFGGVGINAGPLAGLQGGYVGGYGWGGGYLEGQVGPWAGGVGVYLGSSSQ
jgi:hypothetical protein